MLFFGKFVEWAERLPTIGLKPLETSQNIDILFKPKYIHYSNTVKITLYRKSRVSKSESKASTLSYDVGKKQHI